MPILFLLNVHEDCNHCILREIHFFCVSGYGGKTWSKYESECGTSMELHTAHSTEKGNNEPLSMSWLSRNSSLENDHR